ncbi:Hypothetical predicted protein, partial [Marmota monax]
AWAAPPPPPREAAPDRRSAATNPAAKKVSERQAEKGEEGYPERARAAGGPGRGGRRSSRSPGQAQAEAGEAALRERTSESPEFPNLVTEEAVTWSRGSQNCLSRPTEQGVGDTLVLVLPATTADCR